MADLTHPDNFVAFLSAFWSRIFKDRGVVRGLCHNDAYEIQQIYVNFIEAMANLSIGTILPFHKELVVPIILRKSTFSTGPDELSYGSGSSYGPQPANTDFREGVTFTYGGLEKRSGLYYVGVPSTMANLGPVIVNRLVEPSALLARDSDFILGDDILTFKTDPFENALIPKRIVADADGNPEEEIVLWALDVEYETFRVHTQFGHMFSSKYVSSDAYRAAVEALMKAYSDGPSPQILDALMCVLCGQPVTREVTETVEFISVVGGNRLIITDAGVYQVPVGVELRPNIVVGAELEAGSGLTTIAQLFDYTRDPSWWYDVPALAMSRDFLWMEIESLGFINAPVKVELETTIFDSNGDPLRPARFFLSGSDKDVEKFWEQARERGVVAGECLGDLLWRDAGLLDDGLPDFSRELYINPLEFLVTRLIGTHLIVARVQLDLINQNTSFLSEIKHFQQVIPAWCALLIIIEASTEEEYSFQRESGGVEVTEQDLSETSLEDLIVGNVEEFTGDTLDIWTEVGDDGETLTKTPEALCAAITVDTLATTINLSSDAANTAANASSGSYGVAVASITEEITWKTTESCTP